MRFPLEPNLERSVMAFYAEFFICVLRAQKTTISEERALDIVKRANTFQAILDALRAEAARVTTDDREKERMSKPVGHVRKEPPIETPVSFFHHPILWLKRWLSRTH